MESSLPGIAQLRKLPYSGVREEDSQKTTSAFGLPFAETKLMGYSDPVHGSQPRLKK